MDYVCLHYKLSFFSSDVIISLYVCDEASVLMMGDGPHHQHQDRLEFQDEQVTQMTNFMSPLPVAMVHCS